MASVAGDVDVVLRLNAMNLQGEDPGRDRETAEQPLGHAEEMSHGG
jgi:hypothetical protein